MSDDDMSGAAGVGLSHYLATAEDEDTHESTPRITVRAVSGDDHPEHDTVPDPWAAAAPPRMVAPFLKRDETKVTCVQLSLFLLLGPAVVLAGGFAIAATVNSLLYIHHAASPAPVYTLWLLWAAGAAWAAWRWLEWRQTWFVITGHRIMLVQARYLIGRKVAMLPVEKIRDVELRLPAAGRIFGYGTLDFASIGTERALDVVNFLPWPYQLYQQVCEMIMPETERKAMKRKPRGLP